MASGIQTIHKIISLLVFIPIILIAQGRDEWQKPGIIMDSVAIKPGMKVGEIGAGEGYFTFKLAKRVGHTGHIFANDIVQSRLDYINSKCKSEGINNITTVIGQTNDSNLPKDSLDMIFIVYTFHHFDEPVLYLKNLRKHLKPDTPVIIVERDPERYGNDNHFFKKEKILNLVSKAGFHLNKIYTFLERDNIYIILP